MTNAQLGMLANEPRNSVRKSGKASVDVVIRTNRTHSGGKIKSPHIMNPSIATVIRFTAPNISSLCREPPAGSDRRLDGFIHPCMSLIDYCRCLDLFCRPLFPAYLKRIDTKDEADETRP